MNNLEIESNYSQVKSHLIADEDEGIHEDGLTCLSTTAFVIGHSFNDIAAQLQFAYFQIYLSFIAIVPSHLVGEIFFIGQITDGVLTPMIGIVSDNILTPIGKRKPIYIFGVVGVQFGTLGMLGCLGNYNYSEEDDAKQSWVFVFAIQTFFCLAFNIGYAACQVSHMSVIPTSSANEQKRESLVNMRTGIQFFNGIFSALITLQFVQQMELKDALQQSTFLLCTIGLFCCLFFILFQNEMKLTAIVDNQQKNNNNNSNPQSNPLLQPKILLTTNSSQKGSLIASAFGRSNFTILMQQDHPVKILSWLKLKTFWLNLFSQMSARIMQNYTTTSMNQFIIASLHSKSNVNLVLMPLTNILFSFVGSFITQLIISKFQRKFLAAVCNVTLIMLNTLLLADVLFIDDQFYRLITAQVIQGCLGFFTSIYLSVSTCMISDLIGEQGYSGAFVYGFQNMIDKTVVGLFSWTLLSLFDITSDIQIALGVSTLPSGMLLIGLFVLLWDTEKTKFTREDFYY